MHSTVCTNHGQDGQILKPRPLSLLVAAAEKVGVQVGNQGHSGRFAAPRWTIRPAIVTSHEQLLPLKQLHLDNTTKLDRHLVKTANPRQATAKHIVRLSKTQREQRQSRAPGFKLTLCFRKFFFFFFHGRLINVSHDLLSQSSNLGPLDVRRFIPSPCGRHVRLIWNANRTPCVALRLADIEWCWPRQVVIRVCRRRLETAAQIGNQPPAFRQCARSRTDPRKDVEGDPGPAAQ